MRETKSKADLIRQLKALRKRVAELEQANCKHGDDGLGKSEAQFREIFENTEVGVYRTTPDGRILMANAALVRMLGYSEFEELAQRNLEEEGYEPKYSRSAFKKRIERDGQVAGLESAWIRRDGSTVFVIENSRAIRDEHGNTLCYEGTAEDITERKKAEEELRASEEKYRRLFEATGTDNTVISIDGVYLMMNEKGAERLGGKPEDFVGKSVYDTFSRDAADVYVKRFRDVAESGETKTYEDLVELPGGNRWFLTDMWPVKEPDGSITSVQLISHDITEREKMDEALRESEQRFRSLVEATSDWVWEVDQNGIYTYSSPKVKDLLGYEPGEVIGKRPFDLMPPDEAERVGAIFRDIMASRKPFEQLDNVNLHKEGRVVVLETSGVPIFDAGGGLVGYRGIDRDITERKKAEEEIKKFKTIADNAGYGSVITDLEGNLVHVNESFARMHGYSANELVGKNLSLLPNADQMERVGELKDRLLKEGAYVGEEVWHTRKDGTAFPTLMNGTLIRDEQSRPLFLAATAIDITEAKQAEAAQQQSEERYRTLVENLPQRVFLKDRNSTYVSCNENFAHDVGISPELLPGKSDYDLFARELAENYRADDKRVMESGEIRDIEEKAVLQGREMLIHTVKAPVRDEEGNVVGVLGIFWDISEQKRLELALSESEQKYRTLVESAGESIATIDGDGAYLFMNKTGAERAGQKPEDYIGKTIWDVFPKRIADQQMDYVRKVIDSGEGMNVTMWIELQGRPRLYNATVEPLTDESGKVVAAMIIARDITDISRAEEELEAYRESMVHAERLASLGTLSATLAHELTQPLTVIALSIEDSLTELEAVSCPQTVTDGLRDSLSEVSNATSIVERFRNFARKSSEKTVGKVDLKVVAERIVKLLNKSAGQAGVRLCVQGMDRLPAVYSSEKEMEQLFFALVQNAIQAAGGNEPRELIIDGAVKDEYVELRFSDNCGGIEPEDVDKVFDPFFTTKPSGEGTGLGLCIVQRVAGRSGGRVRVENKPGEGSTFVVTLGIHKDGVS